MKACFFDYQSRGLRYLSWVMHGAISPENAWERLREDKNRKCWIEGRSCRSNSEHPTPFWFLVEGEELEHLKRLFNDCGRS